MRSRKVDQLSLAISLEREQADLIARMQSEFWQGLFCDILKKHTYQNDFFFVENNLKVEKVVSQLKDVIYQLCQTYDLDCEVTSHPTRTELKLMFNWYDYGQEKEVMDVLSIIVCQKDITMRILPHNPMLKLFWLEEYVLVENIIKDLCLQIFESQKEKFSELRENYKKIKASSEGLTAKTIEIAQNSIKTLYEKSGEKHMNLVQRDLYSSLLYKGRMIRIFHRDFLKNPNVLLKELN